MDFYEEDIPVGNLEVDVRVQRTGLDESKVAKIVKEFNPEALGLVTVSLRADRCYYIIDGWHRVEAIRRHSNGVGAVHCRVFKDLSIEEEAMLFLALNNTTKPRYADKYRVRVTAGDQIAVGVLDLVKPYGFTVGVQPGAGTIQAIASLERLYKRSLLGEYDPNLVQLTIMTIDRAWGDNQHGVMGPILEGVGRLIEVNTSKIDHSRLATRMREEFPDPRDLMAQARVFSTSKKVRVAMAVAEILTGIYNKGYSSDSKNSLPPWRYRA